MGNLREPEYYRGLIGKYNSEKQVLENQKKQFETINTELGTINPVILSCITPSSNVSPSLTSPPSLK